MKNTIFTGLCVLFLIGFSACKKDEDETTPTKAITVNAPPSTGGYFVGAKFSPDNNKSFAAWSTDFETYSNFTDEFDNVAEAYVEDGNLIIVEYQDLTTAKYFIHFAPVQDLTSFTTVESFYIPEQISVVNGTVVTYSSTFSRTGYCRTAMGEKAITWTQIPITNSIHNLMTINDEVMGKADVNGVSSYVRVTNDGALVSFNVSGFAASAYDFFDGKTWGLGNDAWGTIETNDWANGTWTTDNFMAIIEGNTTAINGSFLSTNLLQILPTEYRIYGYIKEDDGTKITNHACVNKSVDEGITWTTALMPSIPMGDAYQIIATTNDYTLLRYQEQSMSFPDYYSSTNGVDFTKWSTAKAEEYLNTFFNPKFVR